MAQTRLSSKISASRNDQRTTDRVKDTNWRKGTARPVLGRLPDRATLPPLRPRLSGWRRVQTSLEYCTGLPARQQLVKAWTCALGCVVGTR